MTIQDDYDEHDPGNPDCTCWSCEVTAAVLHYAFFYLEPTDRALRPAGQQAAT